MIELLDVSPIYSWETRKIDILYFTRKTKVNIFDFETTLVPSDHTVNSVQLKAVFISSEKNPLTITFA